jgi:hypothetical protein
MRMIFPRRKGCRDKYHWKGRCLDMFGRFLVHWIDQRGDIGSFNWRCDVFEEKCREFASIGDWASAESKNTICPGWLARLGRYLVKRRTLLSEFLRLWLLRLPMANFVPPHTLFWRRIWRGNPGTAFLSETRPGIWKWRGTAIEDSMWRGSREGLPQGIL